MLQGISDMFYPFLSSFLICLVLTPIVRRVTTKKGFVAMPSEDRWHKRPTAMMGGIAIYFSIAIPLLYLTDFQSIIRDPQTFLQNPSAIVVALVGTTLLFILGFLDDLLNTKPHNKLIGQIIVASIVAFLGLRLQWFNSLTIDTLVTIIWIVGITNAFNLLDNMDGLCAGVGLISCLFYFLIFSQNAGSVEFTLLSVILAGSLMAFLFYNFHPASIFMGDSGSLMIGFMLSFLSLNPLFKQANNVISFLSVPLLVLLVPILDTSMVTIIRKLSKRKVSVGWKDHFSHRLVLIGFGEVGAVLILYGIAFFSGLSALFVYYNEIFSLPLVIVPLLIAVTLLAIYLSQLRVYPEGEFAALKDAKFTPILFHLTYKRQIFTIFLDLIFISFSYYISYRLRFGEGQFVHFFRIFLISLPVVVACKFLAFFIAGVYRGMPNYIGISDTYSIIRANILGSLFSFAAVAFLYRNEYFSRGVFIIDWLVLTGLVLASRVSFRGFSEFSRRRTVKGDNVLIYGAGRGGELLLREILNNQRLHLKPIGLIDDDPLKIGKTLHGYPIIGTSDDIEKICGENVIAGIIISSRHIEENHIKRLTTFCKTHTLFLKKFEISLADL